MTDAGFLLLKHRGRIVQPVPDLEITGDPGKVWRVGFGPDPWEWSPWEYATEPGNLFLEVDIREIPPRVNTSSTSSATPKHPSLSSTSTTTGQDSNPGTSTASPSLRTIDRRLSGLDNSRRAAVTPRAAAGM